MSDRPSTRAYSGVRRLEKVDETRRALLDALVAQMVTDGRQDFSLQEAADRAGVSLRTLYRHFPNRDAVLAAMADWAVEQLGTLPYPQSPAEIPALVRQAFPRFEANAELVAAMLLSQPGKALRANTRARRVEAIAKAIEPALAGLPDEVASGRRALIQFLVNAEVWQALREQFGRQLGTSADDRRSGKNRHEGFRWRSVKRFCVGFATPKPG
jgi:AcrR family transcriptional regulator